MKTSEFLITLANWLENADNPALLLSDSDPEQLAIAATALHQASHILKSATVDLQEVEELQERVITAEKVEELALLAQALYEDGDENLAKQAMLIDDLLLTIAAPENAFNQKQASDEDRLNDLRKKYLDTRELQDKVNKVSENTKKIENSDYYKEYRLQEAPLKTRYCPDHAGVSVARVSDDVFQCPMDHRTYNFATGYEKLNGDKVPGGDVSYQTKTYTGIGTSVFDNRESVLQGGYKSDRS